MTAAWKAGNALIAASLSFASIWSVILIWLLCQVPFALYRDFVRMPPGALARMVFYMLAGPAVFCIWTGLVTLAATVVFIFPYVCLRSSTMILLRPWRMYLEPCLFAIASCFLFTGLSSVEPKLYSAALMSCFAIPVSLIGSFFFLWRLHRKLTVSSTRASLSV